MSERKMLLVDADLLRDVVAQMDLDLDEDRFGSETREWRETLRALTPQSKGGEAIEWPDGIPRPETWIVGRWQRAEAHLRKVEPERDALREALKTLVTLVEARRRSYALTMCVDEDCFDLDERAAIAEARKVLGG